MKLTEFLEGVGRSVAFYPGLRKLTGSTTATILLCQLFYWTGKEISGDGWIYKSSEELTEETGLSYDEQVTARKNLVERDLIEEDYRRLEHKMYFRVCIETINAVWEIPETGNAKMGKAESRLSLNGTTEITTENKKGAEKPNFKSLQVSEYHKIPELKTFMSATGWIPGSFVLECVYDFIHAGLTEERIAAAFKAWTAKGFKSSNVEGYLTWARDGIPQSMKSKVYNRPSQPAAAKPKARVIE